MHLQTTDTKQLTISELINVNIPRTHCQGDALAAAVQIVAAAHKAWALESDSILDYGCVISRIKSYLSQQHIAWMRGDN